MVAHATGSPSNADIREHLRHLDQVGSEKHYGRGELIFSADHRSDEIYVVESGRVELVYVSPEGKQKIMAIYQAGDFFGELNICELELKSKLRAVALEPTRTLSFKVQSVIGLLYHRPEFAVDLLILICARLAELQEEIATLAFYAIPQRLAKELVHLASSLPSANKGKGPEVALNLTHEELAKVVGTSREVVTAVMNQFRRRGLVRYGRRNIVVSPERLQEYVGKPQA